MIIYLRNILSRFLILFSSRVILGGLISAVSEKIVSTEKCLEVWNLFPGNKSIYRHTQ